MNRDNEYLEGTNARPSTVAAARALIGLRIQYLRDVDIDRSGRGYYFPRYDNVLEVSGRNIRLENADWMLWGNLVEVRVLGPVE